MRMSPQKAIQILNGFTIITREQGYALMTAFEALDRLEAQNMKEGVLSVYCPSCGYALDEKEGSKVLPGNDPY